MNDTTKSLFFLIVSGTCFWLILDQIWGDKLVTQFVQNILPSSKKNATTGTSGTGTEYDSSKGGVQLGSKVDENGDTVNALGEHVHFCEETLYMRKGKKEDCPYCSKKGSSSGAVTGGAGVAGGLLNKG